MKPCNCYQGQIWPDDPHKGPEDTCSKCHGRGEVIDPIPCPFCGWKLQKLLQHPRYESYRIECGLCRSKGPIRATPKDAEAAWNKCGYVVARTHYMGARRTSELDET